MILLENPIIIFLDQVKQFILASGSIPDQGTKYQSSSLYNTPHNGAYILSSKFYILSHNFITNIVNIYLSGSRLLMFAPSGAEPSIFMDSCFSSSEKKPWSGWLPIGDNHSSKYWPNSPWACNMTSIRFVRFNYLLNESFQHRSAENPFTTQYTCE